MLQSHTILLVQPSDDAKSRTYLDFTNSAQAWDALVRMYEGRLKALTPGVSKISYEVADLFRWLDNLTDISCMM